LIKVIHCENENGNRNTVLRIIIHAEGVSVGVVGSRRYHPRRRRAVWFSVIRAEAPTGLPWWRDALELEAEVVEVVRTDAQFLHFFDDRQEIG